jgi:hypothetical protein
MNEIEVIKRAIELKQQAIPLIKREVEELQERLFLIKLKDRLEQKAEGASSPTLSRKIDCVQFILEN